MYVQTLDSVFAGTNHNLYLRLYHNSSSPRDYPFNINFTANTHPVFSASSISDQIVNWLYDVNITMPSVSDAEGDSVQYQIVPPSNTNFSYQLFPSSNILRIYYISWDKYGFYTDFSYR